MTLLFVMNLGFAWGTGAAPAFTVAWARGINTVIQRRPTP